MIVRQLFERIGVRGSSDISVRREIESLKPLEDFLNEFWLPQFNRAEHSIANNFNAEEILCFTEIFDTVLRLKGGLEVTQYHFGVRQNVIVIYV